jgi:hypothetical protein
VGNPISGWDQEDEQAWEAGLEGLIGLLVEELPNMEVM